MGRSSFSILLFCLFILFLRISRQEYRSGLPFPSPVDHILSDLSTMTRPSWVAPRAWLSFIELDKAVVLVWLDWLVFCEYGFSVFALWCPLATPTVLLGFLLPWTWGISSRLLQQSASTAPYLVLGVSPQCHHSWSWMWTSSSSPSCAHAASTPWTCGISPDYSLEGLTMKLQLQYFVHLMQRTVSLEKILMLGRNESQGQGDERGWDGWIPSGIPWTSVSASSGSWWWTRNPGVLQSMRLHTVGHNWANEMNWLP